MSRDPRSSPVAGDVLTNGHNTFHWLRGASDRL